MSEQNFASKFDDPEMCKKLEELFFDIRNGCVGVALLASIDYTNRKKNSRPSAKQLMLMIAKLLNPEEDCNRPAGISTLHTKLTELSSNIDKPSRTMRKSERKGIEGLIKKGADSGFTITDTGKEFLRLHIEELKRILSILEGLAQ